MQGRCWTCLSGARHARERRLQRRCGPGSIGARYNRRHDGGSPFGSEPIQRGDMDQGGPGGRCVTRRFGCGHAGSRCRGHGRIVAGIAAATVSGSGDTASAASATTTAVSSVADPGASGTISDQVATQLVQLVSSGSHDMVMRLHPPELGDLTVRVAISGRDVSAWFTSPQPQVQSAVSDAIGQLQTNLADAGYNLSGAWVGADASGGRQQGSNLPASPPARAPVAVNAVDPPATVGFRPAASGLNVYV